MYYEVRNPSIDTLNLHIKTALIQDQKLEQQESVQDVQATNCSTITGCIPEGISVRQKIGCEEECIPISELTKESATLHVQRILLMLRLHKIILLFNDPDQDPRNLYTFIMSVFMDIVLPPHPPEMQFCFIYDKLENEEVRDPETLVARVFEPFLQHDRADQFAHLNARVKLNAYDNLSEPELHYVVDRYKSKYSLIMNRNIRIDSKRLLNNRLHMKGVHDTVFCCEDRCDIIHGVWNLELIPIHGTWRVVNIQIEGVEF